jgi:DNA-binding transcriptional MerR regulator
MPRKRSIPAPASGKTSVKRKARQPSTVDEIDLGSDKLYFKIGEVADIVGVPAYVLRYWETEFRAVKPQKSRAQQRVYRRRDVVTLLKIKHLLYEQKFTIAGARKQLKEAPGTCTMAPPSGTYLVRESLAKVHEVMDELRGLVSGADRLERTAADPAAYVREAGGALAILEGNDLRASMVTRPRRKVAKVDAQGAPGTSEPV